MNNFSLLLCKHMKVCSKQHILSKRKESESARNVMKTICVFNLMKCATWKYVKHEACFTTHRADKIQEQQIPNLLLH